jgi:KDO2-lipid IV(A) lauroyltransferase
MILFRLLSKLPFPVLYFIADVFYFLAFYVFQYRKKVVMRNLYAAFPNKSLKEYRILTKDFYRNLSDVIVETLKVLSLSETDLLKRIQFKDASVLTDYVHNGQSVVVMAAHQANWEWLLLASGVYMRIEIDAVYKPLSSPFFEKLMWAIRSRFGAQPVAMNQIARELIRRKNVSRAIAMVADQVAAPESAYWTTFLHQDTPFFPGSAKIAQRTGFPVLYASMQRLRRGYYEITISQLAVPPYNADAVDRITEVYAQQVERAIEANPAQWLWSHKRWKHKRPALAEE